MEKKKKTNYFDYEVEEAIILYNQTSPGPSRDRIYVNKIYPALNKLAENIINTGKFWRYETTYADLKADLVVFLTERLYKINNEKGKAYSYFTRSAYNFCIKKSQDLYKEQVRSGELDEVDLQRNISTEQSINDYRESLKDFIPIWCDFCHDNLNELFKLKIDRKIADAIITLFRLSADIDMYNKKELYILIREHAKTETPYITRVIHKTKKLFKDMFNDYHKTGKINKDLYL